MKQLLKKAGRPGFTLIEVLVTVAVIGVLVAVTVPAVTSQISAADPSRVVSDLVNVTAGIDAFSANMSPASMPGDVEDLANAPSSTDVDIYSVAYANAATRWKGPYIERAIIKDVNGSPAGNAFPSGYTSFVQNDFVKCNSKVTFAGCSQTPPLDYLVVKISPIAVGEFEVINKLIDAGETAGSSSSQSLGKIRYDSLSSTAYYYATPLIK